MSGAVVCVGGAVQDLTFRLHAAPALGTSNPASLALSSGGVARNVAEFLAAIGCDVQLVTAVGEDDAGAALRHDLEEKGVGTQHVRTVPGATTASYAAVIAPDGELTMGLAAMAVLDQIGIEWLDGAWPDIGGWLFCDTNLRPDVLAHVVTRAEHDGIRLVIDAVSTPKVVRLRSRLSGIALLNCNLDEARMWLQHNEFDASGPPDRLAERLIGAGAHAVLITLGAEGVCAADESGAHHIPAATVPVADVTGAGDALIAGALAALMRGSSLTNAARAGTRLAARVLASPGSALS